MKQTARHLAGLGASLVLVATLLATGCGRTGAPTTTGARPAARPATSAAYMAGLAAARNAAVKASATTKAAGRMSAMGDDEEGGDAPAAAPAAPASAGGLRPLPKPTPTPAPGKPAPGPEPDEVDDFLDLLQHYGYHGDRAQLTAAVESVTHQYPLGWDPRVNPDQHFEWWKRTLEGVANTPADYKQQAVYLAQHKFDVVYYVWVSKQTPSSAPGSINFDDEIPLVKGIQDEGLFVQISPRGTVVDYLRIPSEYLNDWNHLIPVPRSLY